MHDDQHVRHGRHARQRRDSAGAADWNARLMSDSTTSRRGATSSSYAERRCPSARSPTCSTPPNRASAGSKDDRLPRCRDPGGPGEVSNPARPPRALRPPRSGRPVDGAPTPAGSAPFPDEGATDDSWDDVEDASSPLAWTYHLECRDGSFFEGLRPRRRSRICVPPSAHDNRGAAAIALTARPSIVDWQYAVTRLT